MSRLLPRLAAVVAISLSTAWAQGLQSNDRIAICGDSITEQKQYSVFMEDYLVMCQPQADLQCAQFGWSGETSWGFLARLKNDVLPFKPTVATTCYGMNDGGYQALYPERAQQYREAITGIVKTFHENGVRLVVLGSPGVVDTYTYKRTEPALYNKTLSELSAIAREVAEQNGAVFADLHTTMIDAMAKAKAKYGDAYPVGGADGVHPFPNGHLIMAYAFLKALGCSGEIGTFTYDAITRNATASDGHRVVSAKKGVIEIESTKYPFCFSGDPKDPSSTAGMIEFIPFNQDLNRLLLVVKSAPAKAKVTWGATTKEFTREQLQAGVNLAAEFLDNPFSAPFAAVDAAVREQQLFETAGYKSMMHSLIDWRAWFPNAAYEEMQNQILEKDEALRAKVRDTLQPVTHTIQIEPVS